MSHRRPSTTRRRHAWLYALPEGKLPPVVTCRGARYEHVQTFKHDFFAATGLYRGPTGLVVLKLGRTTDFLSLPMAWIGTLLTRREIHLYEQAQGLPGIPRLIGRVGPNGLLHEYIAGHPLDLGDALPDTFFDDLSTLLRRLHGRHIAYVDLNKRQNILRGEDGKPYLIDFQISLFLPPTGWRRLPPLRWLLARLQQADHYHCLKHKRRLRPDLLTPQERVRSRRLGAWIQLHRWIARPLTRARRLVLQRLKRNEDPAVTGSSAK